MVSQVKNDRMWIARDDDGVKDHNLSVSWEFRCVFQKTHYDLYDYIIIIIIGSGINLILRTKRPRRDGIRDRVDMRCGW